jgi:hypothetical protein
MLLLIGWQSLLYFAGRPLTSLAGEGVDAEQVWSIRVKWRRIVSLGLLGVIIVASGTRGEVLGHSYLSSPKLRVTNYVHSSTAPESNSSDTNESVRTIIYLDARGPMTFLNMTALSANVVNTISGWVR